MWCQRALFAALFEDKMQRCGVSFEQKNIARRIESGPIEIFYLFFWTKKFCTLALLCDTRGGGTINAELFELDSFPLTCIHTSDIVLFTAVSQTLRLQRL